MDKAIICDASPGNLLVRAEVFRYASTDGRVWAPSDGWGWSLYQGIICVGWSYGRVSKDSDAAVRSAKAWAKRQGYGAVETVMVKSPN